MEKKKSSSTKGKEEKTVLTKIAGKVGYLAGEIAAGKDHLIDVANDAIESMKTAIKDITSKKKAPQKRTPKTKAKNALVKPAPAVAKKATKKIARKVPAPAKKAVKKVAKKISSKK